jgi:tetratricopeptide (TPR) repeat protein
VVLVTLGLAPAAVALQVDHLSARISPELRAVDSVEESSLYGQLFGDLRKLQEELPGSVAVDQLLADLHVELGQDELARPLYRAVLEREPGNGAAINNLGVFHFKRAEYVRAISFFDQAKQRPESALEAAYNLSASHRRLLEFGPADSALNTARNLDSTAIAAWIAEDADVVTLAGGIARSAEIREQLIEGLKGDSRSWQRRLSSAVAALAALMLGVLLPQFGVRGRGGWTAFPTASENVIEKWARRLIPGIASAHAGDGGRTYLAIALPVAAILLPAAGVLGFRVPYGFEPGFAVTWPLSLVALSIYFFLRWRQR